MPAAGSRVGTPSSRGPNATSSPHTPQSHVLPSTEFTFSFSPSTTGRPTPDSSRSEPPNSEPEVTGRLFSLPPARGSSTSTARALFAAMDVHSSPEDAPSDVPLVQQGGIRNYGLSPNRGVSTYGDLYNATPTPSPGPTPSARLDREAAVTPGPASPLSSGVGSMASGIRALVVRSEGDETQNIDADDNGNEGEEEDDGEDDDDDDDASSTYSVRQEELPRAPIYDVHLQEALRGVRNELTQLANAMGRSELARNQESELYGLYQNVESLRRFECPESRIVGFVGDSGVGKSSLINSLLDQEGLARSSGDAACTSVVTEFRNVDDAHPGPYTVEADFMTVDEITELLEELLRSFRGYHTSVHRDVQDTREKENIRASAGRAWETFESLFPDRLESGLNHEFLAREEPGAEDAIVAQLRTWAMAGLVHRPGGADALLFSASAHNIEECKDVLEMLTRDSPNRERPAIWPFVKLMRVYLRSRILRTGLVLADLPGFRDMNYARVRATERYLRHSCDEVFVVGEIGRISTDPAVDEIVNRRIGDQPLRIVCTKSEATDPGETPRESPLYREIQQLLRERDVKNTASRKTRSRRQKATGPKASSLALEEARLNDQVERINLKLSTLSIERRNETVTSSLLRRFPRTAQVFCVSNVLYTHHRDENGQHAPDYINLSGIPGLRRCCQSVPAEAQLRATSAFLENRVPAVLGSINRWSQAGSDAVTVDRAETLRRTLTEAQNTIRLHLSSRNSCIRPARASLYAQFHASVLQTCRNSRNRWTTAAIRICQGWATMYHSSYAAFCRKYGFHTPKGESFRSWNQEILEAATEELSRGWDTVLDSLSQQQQSVETRISDTFESVYSSLEEHTHLAPQALEILIDIIEAEERCVGDIMTQFFDGLYQHTERTKSDAIYDHDTSYIAGVMRPAYNACSAQSGTGSDAKRKALMKRHVEHSQMFLMFSNKIQTDYDNTLNEAFTELQENLEGEVRNILRELGTAITVEGEVTEAGQFPALADVVREGIAQTRRSLTEAQTLMRGLQRN